jgi:hypothetical protein
VKRTHSLVIALALAGCGTSTTPAPADVVDAATHAHDAESPDVAPGDASDVRPMTDVPSRCVNGVGLPYPDGASTLDELQPLPDLRFDAATAARIGLDRLAFEGATVTLARGDRTATLPVTCADEVRFASPRDYLLGLLPTP